MAQQDKTDWYWNGALSGTVNNIYYDLINVDVTRVPYSTSHRNSSFFLKTRLGYQPEKNWETMMLWLVKTDWDITDVHIVWDEKCSEQNWKLYLLGRKQDWWKWKRKLFTAPIEDGCVWQFSNPNYHSFETTVTWCWDWKFLVTDYVRGKDFWMEDALTFTSEEEISGGWTWIQINKVTWWTTVGQFQDENTVAWYAVWNRNKVTPWTYLLVYKSENKENSWFAWQVRMVTAISDDGRTIELDSPWLGFKVPTEDNPAKWWDVSYKFFSEWWEVVWFTDGKKIQLITDYENDVVTTPYEWENNWYSTNTNIIWTASANDKIFILTDNWYIHYNNDTGWYNKFFINDDMFAWIDKIAVTAYKDIVLAFWRKHIAVWIPDEQNRFWTMYNQSTTIWLWSRYSFAEYDWDLIFVSNDKRLLTLKVAGIWRYWLEFVSDRPWIDRINSKLSTLVEWDEVYIWNDKNDLRVFVNTKNNPYKASWSDVVINDVNNTLTHIYKFDTLFRVWTEDHIPHFLLRGVKFWIYFWQYWIYRRWWYIWDDEYEDVSATVFSITWRRVPVETKINAFMIENENNWLDNHPLLFQLAKLNRLITTLWPWVYSDTSKIRVTSYSKWIGYTYEFPISWDWNNRVWLITSYYLDEDLSEEDEEKIECMLSVLQDSQKQYQPNCPDGKVLRQYMRQSKPWCDSYEELITESHWVCINDKIYELAPTMPLVTEFGENQQYSTQIKIELIWWQWDIICFGWWLAELFIAPLFMKWPDWEYQLQPNTDCD